MNLVKAERVDIIELDYAINLVTKTVEEEIKRLYLFPVTVGDTILERVMILRDYPESIFSQIGLGHIPPPDYHRWLARAILKHKLKPLEQVGT